MHFTEMTDEALALFSAHCDSERESTPEDDYIDLDFWGADR